MRGRTGGALGPAAEHHPPQRTGRSAPCPCGGRIVATVPAFVRRRTATGEIVQLSGVTLYACDRCGREETRAMQEAMRASSVRGDYASWAPCANPECTARVAPKRAGRPGRASRYHSKECNRAHLTAKRTAEARARRAAERAQ